MNSFISLLTLLMSLASYGACVSKAERDYCMSRPGWQAEVECFRVVTLGNDSDHGDDRGSHTAYVFKNQDCREGWFKVDEGTDCDTLTPQTIGFISPSVRLRGRCLNIYPSTYTARSIIQTCKDIPW